MSDSSYSEILRDLSRSYYNRSISLEDYRAQRRQILNAIDQQYNGVELGVVTELGVSSDTGSMTTVFYGPTDTQPNFRK